MDPILLFFYNYRFCRAIIDIIAAKKITSTYINNTKSSSLFLHPILLYIRNKIKNIDSKMILDWGQKESELVYMLVLKMNNEVHKVSSKVVNSGCLERVYFDSS